MDLKVVELFAGVGGFRVGLNHISEIDVNGRAIENGDWEFVWVNQFEPSTKIQHAYDCYVKRFGGENNSNIDIQNVKKYTIPNHTLLVGGFPCQDYSVARSLSNEKGIEGKKGVLFWEIKKVLEVKETPFVLLENVDRLLKSPAIKRGRDFAIMLKTFNDLNYDVQWRVINAGDYSMPQKRRRVFIFAYKKYTKFAKTIKNKKIDLFSDNIFNSEFKIGELLEKKEINLNAYENVLHISNDFSDGKFLESGIMVDGRVLCANFLGKIEEKYSLREVLKKAQKVNGNLEKYIIKGEKLEKFKYLKSSKKIQRISKKGFAYTYSEGAMAFPDKFDEPARTMLTSEGTVNRSSHIIYDQGLNNYRILTPIECELIQMFPINWTNTMTDKRRYFMMGNALVTGIISRMENKLKNIIVNE